MVTRYDDIRALAKSGLPSRQVRGRAFGWIVRRGLFGHASSDGRFQFGDDASYPPAHTRLRGLVNKAFTTRIVDQLRPRIQQIIDELLDAVDDAAYIDVIGDFAYPLPASVIMELRGVPLEDRPRLKYGRPTE